MLTTTTATTKIEMNLKRRNLLTFEAFVLALFLLLSSPSLCAAQSQPFAYINITNGAYAPSENITIMENNWVELQGGVEVTIPKLTFVYNGFNETNYTQDGREINITIEVDENTDHEVEYPLSYTTHQFFYNDSTVEIAFDTSLNMIANYSIAKTYPTEVVDIADALLHGNTTKFRNLFNGALSSKGMVSLPSGTVSKSLEAGDYILLLTDKSLSENDFTIISATLIEVLEYKSELTAPSSIEQNENIDVTMNLIGAPEKDRRYGGVLIKKEVYEKEREIRLTSDATKIGTTLTIDGVVSLIENWEIFGVGLGNVDASIAKEKIEGIINKADACSVNPGSTSKGFTITTDDLPTGTYILSVGVWQGSDKLVAFNQKEIKIEEKEEEKIVTGGGGGGGGGVSLVLPPEEIIIPIPGTKIFRFTLLGLEVSIDLKNMTKDAKVSLKIMGKPAEVPDPPGTVYSYFENPTNLEPENIHSISMSFRVNKSWTIINNISVETIKLCRYASATGWEELETTKIKEDEDYFYFSADTPGLSVFAITGEKKGVGFVPSAATTTTPITPTTPTTPTPPVVPPKPPGALIIIGILIIAVIILGAVVYYYYYYLY